MAALGIALLAVCAFCLALVFLEAVAGLLTGSPRHRDAKQRNRHNRAGDPWREFDREWMTPRQEQPR